MSEKPKKKLATKGLHYHVSDLKDVDPLGLHPVSCDVALKQTVADYMTSIERKPYENQHICRKNGIRGHRNKGYGGRCGGERLKSPAPGPQVNKKTLKEIAQDYFTTLETDYVVTDLNSVTVGTDKDKFLQLTTEPNAPNFDEHLYDTITGHYKKKERGVNNGGCDLPSNKKQDAYYLDIIDDYSKSTLPTSCHSYDEVKNKTLSLSRYKNLPRGIYVSANRDFLNRARQMMTTELLLKLIPATRNKRVIIIAVATVLLLCSIWLLAASSQPDHTNALIFPTQSHPLIGGTEFHTVTVPIVASLEPASPESECSHMLYPECRDKLRTNVCVSNGVTYETYGDTCEFRVAKCKNPSLKIVADGSCDTRSEEDTDGEDDD